MPQVYSKIEFSNWPVFEHVKKSLQERIILVHIFGDEGRSAIFITDDDTVYGVGGNDMGRLGIGDVDFSPIPVDIPYLHGKQVKCFASGSVHTIALTEHGELFSWGNNTLGRLGNGTILDRTTPGRVLLPTGTQVQSICCADRYSLALTYDNKVLHWGDIQFSSCAGQNIPCEIHFPYESIIIEIACGGFHAAAMATNGLVYTWGVNSMGQLGRELEGQIDPCPGLIERCAKNGLPVKIGCGLLTTIILNENKRLESWGYFTLQDLQCSVDDFMIANMDHTICIQSNNEFYFYGNFENEEYRNYENEEYIPKLIDVPNMQSAFGRRTTPQFLRANPSDLVREMSTVEAIQGTNRDISEALYDRKDHSDLTIKLSDGIVYVHRLILVTFCEHFKNMLLGSWGPEAKNEMDMESYNPKAYRAFLKYVYSGRLDPLFGPELIDLYKIAESYFESDLKIMVVIMFRKRLKPENLANLYALAHAGFCEELIELCYEYACGCVDEVILSDGFDKLSPELSKTLIKQATKRKKKNI